MSSSPAPLALAQPLSRLRRFALWTLGLTAPWIVLASAVWIWSGLEGSLGTALQMARSLPPLRNLVAQEVRGNLRHGGQLEGLEWASDHWKLQCSDIRLQLDWSALRHGRLPLSRLHIGKVDAVQRKSSTAPLHPPASLVLPLRVDLPFSIGHLRLQGPVDLQLQGLVAQYRHDREIHDLQVQDLQVASGHYQGALTVQARAPLKLSAQLQGQASTTLRGRTQVLKLQAQARLSGALAADQEPLMLEATVDAAGSGQPRPLSLQARLNPWQAQPLHDARAKMHQLPIDRLWPDAPQARLSGEITAQPTADGWALQADLINHDPGPWDRQHLPVDRLRADLEQAQAVWHIRQLTAQIGSGRLQAQGRWQASGWEGSAQLGTVPLGRLHTALEGTVLGGRIEARQTQEQSVELSADLRPEGPGHANPSGAEFLKMQGQWSAGRWQIESLQARLAGASLQGQGAWLVPQRVLEGQWRFQAPGLQGQWHGQLGPDAGQGQAQLSSDNLTLAHGWLMRWNAWSPMTIRGAPQGSMHMDLGWRGGWSRSDTAVQADLRSPSLRWPELTGPARIESLHSRLEGTVSALEGRLGGVWSDDDSRWHLQTQLQARNLQGDQGWQGQWQQAQVRYSPSKGGPSEAPATLQLQEAVDWQWRRDSARVLWRPMRWQLRTGHPLAARLDIEAGQWTPGSGAISGVSNAPLRAQVLDLPLSWASRFGLPPLQGGLMLRADLALSQLSPLRMELQVQRQQGDLTLRGGADHASGGLLQAGVREARAHLVVEDDHARLEAVWNSEQAGEARIQASARRQARQGWLQAGIEGRVQARWPQLGSWSWLAPPGWRMQGSMEARFDLLGTLSQPRWQGQLQARQLALRSAVQGVEFSQGQLTARLQDRLMELEEFRLRGAGAQGGELQGKGRVLWPEGPGTGLRDVRMLLQLQSHALRISNRADRRLTVSGDLQAQLDKGKLQLRGRLAADQALFILPEDTTPRLGDDVVITPSTDSPRSQPSTSFSILGTPDVQVTLALGPDFQLRGQGVRTRLTGTLQLTSNAASQGLPRLAGEVLTEGGQYKAYGQQLDIDQGVLRFSGPYDNPALDFVALRPNLGQRIGVRVSGNAQAPRIRLYADPEMPDADKLAWLVLGRAPGSAGTESAILQQAALALLGGNGPGLGSELAQALGLDAIGLAPARSDNASGAAITLGKRLSKDFYLAYESSVSGTVGSLFIFYDISRRLTLRAQAGDLNALDLVYTVRKD